MMLLLFLLAFGPSLVWAYWLWTRDRFQREPLKLVAILLFGGGLLSVTLTLLSVSLFSKWIPSQEQWPMLNMLFSAALPEELFKFLPVMLFAWRSKHWDEPFDGIVYAGASALGFHLIETASYMAGRLGNLDAALYQALIRGAKPGHMLYGIAMGYFLSKAKFGAPQDRWKNFALALGVPVALHLAWNTAATYGGAFVDGRTIGEILFALIAWGLSVSLWITAFRYIRKNQQASPWNPEAWTVPMAPTGCPTCGGGYPQHAYFCQTCGTQVAVAAAQHPGTT